MDRPSARTVLLETHDEEVTSASCLSPEAAIFSRYQKAVLRYTGNLVKDTPENRAAAIRFHDEGLTFQEAGILQAMALVEDGAAAATVALQEAVDSLPPERLALMHQVWRQGGAMDDGAAKKTDPKDLAIKVLALVLVVVVGAWAVSATLPDIGDASGDQPVSAEALPADDPPEERTASPEPDFKTRLVEAQQRLKQMGLYESKVDGLYGPGTKAALRAFQARNGLEQTGKLDAATYGRLRNRTTTERR